MARITKRIVDAAAPAAERFYIWDERLSGFGLIVLPTGVKSYVFQYRSAEGQSRRITIGRHGDSLTAERARDLAEKHASSVRDGGDPLAVKRARRNAKTVADLLDAYVESPAFADKTDITRANDRGRIVRHLKPLLGTRIAEKITADDIVGAQKQIEAGKTAAVVKTGPRGVARVTGGAGAARMAIRLLKSAYSWAYLNGVIKANPAAGVKVGADGQRDTVIGIEEYSRLFATLQTLESQLKIRPQVADAIRVIALTGARRGEIAGLRRRHVDLRAGRAVLPPREHKTGRKTGKPRVIELPTAAQAIIARYLQAKPEGKDEDFVFEPSRGEGDAAISLSKPWRAVRAAAGLSPTLGLHGLRHSFATNMAHDGMQAAQIMAVLGHRSITTAQHYIHVADQERSTLADRASAGIAAALTGTPRAEVVPVLTRGRTKA